MYWSPTLLMGMALKGGEGVGGTGGGGGVGGAKQLWEGRAEVVQKLLFRAFCVDDLAHRSF